MKIWFVMTTDVMLGELTSEISPVCSPFAPAAPQRTPSSLRVLIVVLFSQYLGQCVVIQTVAIEVKVGVAFAP
jgi:hypothetical protein